MAVKKLWFARIWLREKVIFYIINLLTITDLTKELIEYINYF